MGTYENARKATRKRIRDEFWNIYRNSKSKKITVEQVANAAAVHRSTFYFHYKDIYEILEETEAELMQDLEDIHIPDLFTENKLDQIAFQFYHLYSLKRDYLHTLVIDQKRPEFAIRYRKKMQEKLYTVIMTAQKEYTPLQQKVIDIVVAQIVETLLYCADDTSITYQEMLQIIKGFGLKGYYHTMAENFDIQDIMNPFHPNS